MQKKALTRTVILSALCLCFTSSVSLADIQWLPKYQEKLVSRKRVSDAKNPTFYDPNGCQRYPPNKLAHLNICQAGLSVGRTVNVWINTNTLPAKE